MSTEKEQKSCNADSTSLRDTPALLLFDLIGPFVTHFQKGNDLYPGTVYICAPLCPEHHANLITDTNDFSLFGLSGAASSDEKGYVYRFSDKKAPAGVERYYCEEDHYKKLLLVKFDGKPKSEKVCHLMFEVPCPDQIVPLHSELVWIHRNGATQWVANPEPAEPLIVNSPRARGLRFIYRSCSSNPIVENTCYPEGKQTDFTGFDATTLGFPAENGPAPYTMTLRFASNSSTPDEHHEDAYNCFQTMRDLMKPDDFSRWRVDFDDTTGTVTDNLTGSTPRDCGASVLALQDWDPKKSIRVDVITTSASQRTE